MDRDYRSGATKLPGRTDPKRPKDTIPAELSPGEAVLNAPAASKLGRDRIAKLNAEGNASRGTNDKGKPLHKPHAPAPSDETMDQHADRLHPVRKNV